MDNLIGLLLPAIKPMFSFAGEGGGASGGSGGEGGQGGQGGASGAGAGAGSAGGDAFSWKSHLGPDLMNSPSMQKFPDTKEGLVESAKSYMNLEKLLGHEKVPVPKGPEDTEAWNLFSKAMGIPDKAEAYGLPDAAVPESMKGMAFDKNKFAEIVHAHKLTPGQAKGLWDAYTNMTKESYQKALKDHEAKMTEVVNKMRGEWGDAYDSNVQLGQLVINKFSDDQEMQDFVTATLAKDPRGIKFLAKIGSQFAENKIGEFGYQKFSLTPDQAESEIQAILNDPKHPYNNDRAPQAERDRAIDYVNSLYAAKNKGKG